MNETESDKALFDLLPWYVNGTLTAQEHQQVEAFIARSAEAAAEVAVLQTVQAVMQQEEPVDAPVEIGWRRLQRQITDTPVEQRSNLWQRFVATAAVLVIAVQFMLIWDFQQTGPDIELLGGGPQQVIDGQFDVQVIFSNQVGWDDIQQLLTEIEGEIVAGPSAMGLVQIRVQAGQSSAVLLEQLQQSPLVNHAQIVADE